jgi:hypothetical protein
MARAPKIPGETSEPLPETPVAAVEAPSPSLPNHFEVDPQTSPGPVLTRQGWIVPAPKPKA